MKRDVSNEMYNQTAYFEKDIRYYPWKGQRFPSVTSIITQVLPTPALDNWKRNQLIIKAADNRKMLATLTKVDTIKFLKNEEENPGRETAATKGTNIHAYIESVIKGQPIPEVTGEERLYVEQFEAFCAEFRPEWLDSEFAVYSRLHGYAGRADALVRIRGTEFILDFKTGKRVYPDVALQLAAYNHGDFVGRDDGTESRLVSGAASGLVLRLGAEEYESRRVDAGSTTFETFLSLIDIFGWEQGGKDYVLREELAQDD